MVRAMLGTINVSHLEYYINDKGCSSEVSHLILAAPEGGVRRGYAGFAKPYS